MTIDIYAKAAGCAAGRSGKPWVKAPNDTLVPLLSLQAIIARVGLPAHPGGLLEEKHWISLHGTRLRAGDLLQ